MASTTSPYAPTSAAVDRLARPDAPIDRLSIIAEGVLYVEDVVGARSLGSRTPHTTSPMRREAHRPARDEGRRKLVRRP